MIKYPKPKSISEIIGEILTRLDVLESEHKSSKK